MIFCINFMLHLAYRIQCDLGVEIYLHVHVCCSSFENGFIAGQFQLVFYQQSKLGHRLSSQPVGTTTVSLRFVRFCCCAPARLLYMDKLANRFIRSESQQGGDEETRFERRIAWERLWLELKMADSACQQVRLRLKADSACWHVRLWLELKITDGAYQCVMAKCSKSVK